ncbi:twin-arginine translocase subunit TatC [Oceanirhabdus sp. W0125-5]|uniref:twin-arginine translocase subunit TatC n=1 Tax=Oceanirhabdus sp. W0125-5 TaxID=2999116 RepID=UPI0022F32967|nr:twin-arginine translocase subunit TatC [Oceanirhabdus sp. W0125-5]WBW95809.1 twin-arginine translocase subunit TatC [Oceanirhabdus sp. W0125-5]
MSKEFEEMSIIDHLDEVRKRILICCLFITIFSVLAYMKSAEITSLMKGPLDTAGKIDLVFITPLEGFLTKLKVAVFGGIVLSSPIIFLQTLLFISPAMYKKEKIIVFSCLPFIVALFFSGIYFCFAFILPTTLSYLMSFGNEHMVPMLSVGKYFSFVIGLTVAMGSVFELPMIMLLLSKFGILNYKTLAKKRKYAVLVIVIITAIITPTPDAFTLLAVSLPLTLLFELSLGLMYLYSKITSKNKTVEEKKI